MRSSMKMRSSESQCHCCSSSPSLISSSRLRSAFVSSALRFRISRTPRNCGLVVLDHAGRRRKLHLAVGEDVELLDDLLGLAALRQVDQDLDLVGRVVVDVLDLDLALGVGGQDRLDQRLGRRAEGQLGDREEGLAAHLDLRPDLHLAAALAVVVLGEVGDAAGREVGKDPEGLSLEVVDRRPAEVVEVVRQDLGREADRDALGPLEEHDRELGRQRHRLPGAAVVAQLPGRRLRVEEDLPGEGASGAPRCSGAPPPRRPSACCRSCPAAR